MAHDIDIVLATLARLLASLERNPGLDVGTKEVMVKAREELSRIAQITSSALALQQQHETWNKT